MLMKNYETFISTGNGLIFSQGFNFHMNAILCSNQVDIEQEVKKRVHENDYYLLLSLGNLPPE